MKIKIEKELKGEKRLPLYLQNPVITEGTRVVDESLVSELYQTKSYFRKLKSKPILQYEVTI